MQKRFDSCPCCASKDLELFTKHTSDFQSPANWMEFFYGGNHLLGQILQCENCGFHYLAAPSTKAGEFYKVADISDYMNVEKPRGDYFKKLKANSLRIAPKMENVRTCIDMGCASGSWLVQWDEDCTRIGIELNEDFREILENRNIQMQNSIDSVTFEGPAIISAFDFLEHVDDPLAFLQSFSNLPYNNESYYVFGVPDMGRIWAKIMGSKYYLYCPMHFNYFQRKSLSEICARSFPEHKVTIVNSPWMYTNVDGILKWIMPSLDLGKLGSLPVPVGYRSNIVAVVSPAYD